MSRRLLIVPIIHTEVELGSEGDAHRAGYVARHGDRGWAEREALIGRYWDAVQDALLELRIDFEDVKLYQDSLPDGPGTERLVEEMAAQGSPNHRLLRVLQARGARVMGTESLGLLLEEYQAIKAQRDSPELLRRSLDARDAHIAGRIDETLAEGEIGILFIGAAHDVARHCDPSIQVAVLSSGAPHNRDTP
jgi:hypothetical protein